MSDTDFANYDTPAVLTDNHILTTTVSGLTSSLDLNTVLGNVNGAFSWGGTNFSAGAANITITDGYVLEADLPDSTGNLVHAVAYLGSTVADHNGTPALTHSFGADHSTAHAEAGDNAEADNAVLGRAATQGSSSIASVKTTHGDASTYWPDGNAPAAGGHHSKAMSIIRKLIVHIDIIEI